MEQKLKRPEKKRVLEDELKYWKTGIYAGVDYLYQEKPFTGFAVLDYHENGNVANEWEYHNGERVGWDMEYHENGKVARESLEYGDTTIVFYEYDDEGNKISGGFVASKRLYNACARLIGIDEILED